MLTNYIKIAWRNLLKNKAFATLNILGLAIGVACCLLMLLWAADERSYDRWNPAADRTFRINTDINFGGNRFHMAVVPTAMGPAIKNDYPEVEAMCRMRDYGTNYLRKAGDVNSYKEENMRWVDSTFFDVFAVPILVGDARTALTQPYSMAIDLTHARRWYGSPEAALGQSLSLNNDAKEVYKITAVFADLPRNTHFKAGVLAAMSGNREAIRTAQVWLSNNFHTYFRLRPDTDPAQFEKSKFPQLMEKYLIPQVKQTVGMDYHELVKQGSFVRYSMMCLSDIYLHSDYQIEPGTTGNIQYVWLFTVAAFLILGIACANFTNLSTARSARRAREVGVRKALGSFRSSLMRQFLTESILMSALSFVVALGLALALLPLYNNLADKQLELPWSSAGFWTAILGGVALVGILAGAYPAFFLSAFNPVRVLKGQVSDHFRGGGLRSVLVVFQFACAVFLIAGTILITRQLAFIQNANIGFDKEQVVILKDAFALENRIADFRDRLARAPGVLNASVSSYMPVANYNRSDRPFTDRPSMTGSKVVSSQDWQVDFDYVKTLGLQVVAGRDFSKDMGTDSSGVLINETAAREFAFDDSIGKKIYASYEDGPENDPNIYTEMTILGVVRDFHFESMTQNIDAVVLRIDKDNASSIAFRVAPAQTKSFIETLRNAWQDAAPGMPFNYAFLDEDYDRMYRSEMRLNRIFQIFSMVSIFVCCLGLFGLAAYTAERRTKEIGVRKVLGASVTGIITLLSKDFLRLVLISIVLASPLAWWVMRSWLNRFVYRIDIEWWMFALAGALAVLIAGLTVSVQSLRAALANPVRSLRSE